MRGRVQQLSADVHDIADHDNGRGGEIRRASIRDDALEFRYQHLLLGQGRRADHGRRRASGQSAAHQRGRNESWYEDAVRKSKSIGEGEALKLHVIDLVANDLHDLLVKSSGRTVTSSRLSGRSW